MDGLAGAEGSFDLHREDDAIEELDWIDSRILSRGIPFTLRKRPDGVQFRHIPLGMFLPPPMVTAARMAQRQGQPTMLEAMQLLFGRIEWLIAARSLYWTPYGPVPSLLAALVEAYGVDAELHGNEPEALANAVAVSPLHSA